MISNKANIFKKHNSKLKVGFVFIFMLLFFSTNIFSTSMFDYPISTVFIDPGHGGKDSGAIASYDFNALIEEKDIVLDIALSLKEYLENELSNTNIILTRKDDTYISLQNRSEIAYKTPLPDKTSSLYISIHANSATTSAKGFEIFTKMKNKIIYLFDSETPVQNISLFANDDLYTLNNKQYNTSFELATNILNKVTKSFPNIKNRGIKSEDLYVLNVSRTTSCLVEVGFLSNEEEAKQLLDSTYRDTMAKAIGDGIIETIKNRR
ncbi:MAG: N-acetylmuramoyl-L-alanine amidase [Sphaerochaetaceae bacterium]|nr:N-acetylmuramoyl-L-alanine amidase [Sphaerochaetaceae bacterium]